MIEYRVGDVLAVPERPALLVHVCNDAGRWGAGFTAALDRRWPEVGERYRRWAHGRAYRGDEPFALGAVDLAGVEDGLVVANMVAQHGVRGPGNARPIRYDHLETCLRSVARVARRDTMGVTVAMPRIGCGLAGGSWDHVGPLVAETLDGVPVVVYDLNAAQEPATDGQPQGARRHPQ